MSYCKVEGKDKIIFATKDDHQNPSTVELSPADPADIPAGAVSADGVINWECPCLGNMPHGPCGNKFREAFSCFVEANQNSSVGAECIDKLTNMSLCMEKFPGVYNTKEELPAHEVGTSDMEDAQKNLPEDLIKYLPDDSLPTESVESLEALVS